jgi:hypothetical protein
MGPWERTRLEILELLDRAAEQAEHAEHCHAAAAGRATLEGRPQQAALDAAAMQLIELAGCGEEFKRGRGEPGTTLGRLDDALRPIYEMRTAHTHPESAKTPPPVTPRRLGDIMEKLEKAVANLDRESLKVLPASQTQELIRMGAGLVRIKKDGLPDPEKLRPRDLRYAAYYHEIQFGRLAKATGLYDNWGKTADARRLDVNSSIYDVDDLAHKFHAMRAGPDKSILPRSVVLPDRRHCVPGRVLSDLMRELRHDYQTPAERLNELQVAEVTRIREQHREAVQGLATSYVGVTGDPKSAALIRDYVQRREPRLDREAIDEMRTALQVAHTSPDNYMALPEAVRRHCLEMCLSLDEQGDDRLLALLDSAEKRSTSAALTPQPQAPAMADQDIRLARALAARSDDGESQTSDGSEHEQQRSRRKRGRSL